MNQNSSGGGAIACVQDLRELIESSEGNARLRRATKRPTDRGRIKEKGEQVRRL